MRGLPFFKPKNKPQFAGLNFSDGGGGGSIDTSALANKTDLTAIILTGTTNTSGNVISAGTWFYLNGKPCIAKVDIASGATFTEGTNYEEKTVGSALSELNGNNDYSTSPHVIGFKNNIYANLATDTFESDIKQGHTYSMLIDGTGLYGAYVWYFYKKTEYGGFAIVMSSAKDYCFSVAIASDNVNIDGARRLA